MLTASITFLTILSLSLIAVLSFDTYVCIALLDWYGAALDLFVIASTIGGLSALGWHVIEERKWQKLNDKENES